MENNLFGAISQAMKKKLLSHYNIGKLRFDKFIRKARYRAKTVSAMNIEMLEDDTGYISERMDDTQKLCFQFLACLMVSGNRITEFRKLIEVYKAAMPTDLSKANLTMLELYYFIGIKNRKRSEDLCYQL